MKLDAFFGIRGAGDIAMEPVAMRMRREEYLDASSKRAALILAALKYKAPKHSSSNLEPLELVWACFGPLLTEDIFDLVDDRIEIPLERALELQPDGGQPGRDEAECLFKSAVLLYCLLVFRGGGLGDCFRMHIEQLTKFLRNRMEQAGSKRRRKVLSLLPDKAKSDKSLPEPGNMESLLSLCDPASHKVAWHRLCRIIPRA